MKERFFSAVVDHRKPIIAVFLVLSIIAAFLKPMVGVNYDMSDYLPKDSPSTVSLDVMKEEFDGEIPNARVMVKDVTVPEALAYKEKLEAVDGVLEVTWLDDAGDIDAPLETQDRDMVEDYYKDSNALFTVTLDEEKELTAVDDIRKVIGEDNAMTGSAVDTAIATKSTVKEIRIITVFAVIFVLLILILTTKSWLEPLWVFLGLGVAILINGGSNLIFGEISFVTNAAGSILQ
ncbi:MAG: MMPL family transporter, partial [Clostridia bacterium]